MYHKRLIEKTILKHLNNYFKPIVIDGARQVGKTTTIKKVLEEFDSIQINLLEEPGFIDIFKQKDLTIHNLIYSIELFSNKKITNDTVLFIDEIQMSEEVFASLKTFNENQLFKVIVSGSNIKPSISNFSKRLFPVGQFIQFELFPLSFSEFLLANDNKLLLDSIIQQLKNKEIADFIHDKVYDQFLLYLTIGGMPAVINTFLSPSKDININTIKEQLIDNYIMDFSKYASDKDIKYLRKIYQDIPRQLGEENQNFIASRLDETKANINDAIEWIESSKNAIKCSKLTSNNLPLISNKTNKYKLFLNDVGLLITMAKYNINILEKQNEKIFYGQVIENYIATVLIKYDSNIFYYHKGQLEIDFLLQRNNKIIPLEIKSGNNTKAKSLRTYIDKFEPDFAYKITKNNLKFNEKFVNLPLYSLDIILEYQIEGYGLIENTIK